MPNKKVLVLGSAGKMGTALCRVFRDGYSLICKNSKDFDAADFNQVRKLIDEAKADIVINTVAILGIDPCEKEPEKAFRLNTVYPKFLAELSSQSSFLLVHFSTDAVFRDKRDGFCIETDPALPLNIYGFTKYGGDCFIQTSAERYYIFRVSVLFGETPKDTQFVEKMLKKVKEGSKVLRISGDIISSPTYSKDVAVEVKRIIEDKYPFGVYHISNEGSASLCDLMREIVKNLDIDLDIQEASYKEFPYLGIKNTYTPLKSVKLTPLRPWREAVKEYCDCIKINWERK